MGQACVESLMEAVKSIEDSMKHVKVMNIFMVESINRLLDCSKVQTGMKLVPKHETLHIDEALELPITCMSVSQSRIGIYNKSKPVSWTKTMIIYISFFK